MQCAIVRDLKRSGEEAFGQSLDNVLTCPPSLCRICLSLSLFRVYHTFPLCHGPELTEIYERMQPAR